MIERQIRADRNAIEGTALRPGEIVCLAALVLILNPVTLIFLWRLFQ